jgi:hypothetical protein
VTNAVPPEAGPPAPAATQNAPSITTAATTQTEQASEATASQPAPESTQEEEKERPVVVKGLEQVPAGQWEQHKPSGGNATDESTSKKDDTPKPAWFETDHVSDFEIAVLPEWFDDSARHRNRETYLQARNQILRIAKALGNKYVTGTLVRRSIPGDAGSLLRLHEFLNAHALINRDITNESAPTPSMLLGPASSALYWNADLDQKLLEVIVSQAREQSVSRKADDQMDTGDDEGGPSVDWEASAKEVGRTALQCEQRFLTMPPSSFNPPAGSVTPDMSEKEDAVPTDKDAAAAAVANNSTAFSHSENSATTVTPAVVQEWVMDADPSVVQAVVEVATQHTTSLPEAQKAALAGLHLSEVAQKAHSAQDALSHVVSHVVDLRLQKLEARMALLDDVEGLLEAERVALELERRDLYTARCRHWFGGP